MIALNAPAQTSDPNLDPDPGRPAVATTRPGARRRLHALVAPAAWAVLTIWLALVGPQQAAHAQFAQPAEPAGPQPTLPRVALTAGIHVIRAEVAADFGTRMRGLMFRERLGANEGMLFVFERKDLHCFWMRNTLVPLSIAFLDDAGGIVNVEDMTPRSDESHCPAKPVRYALEMEKGWFARRGLAAGTRIEGLPRP